MRVPRWMCLVVSLVAAGPYTANAQAVRVELRPARLTIGEASGADAEFGDVRAVARGAGAVTFVLDSKKHEIRAFSDQGRLVSVTSRSGSGPGELGTPRSLVTDGHGNLHVLELSNLRISVFSGGAPTTTGNQAYLRSIRLPLFGASMCMIGDRYFLFALQRDSILHSVSGAGALERSFGVPYNLPGAAPHPQMHVTLSKGYLLCDEATSTVVVVALHVGEVRGYAPDGRLKWKTMLRPYTLLNIRPIGPRGVEYAAREGGWHETVSLVVLRDGLVAVQAGFTDERLARTQEYAKVTTHLIDVRTGRLVGVQEDLPLFGFGNEKLLVALTEDPVPTLTLHEYSLSKGP